MNEELAIKLKEAGFPHSRMSRKVVRINDIDCEWISPNLSQLIYETASIGFSLKRNGMDTLVPWIAENDVPNGSRHFGSTPEEAVALLWLQMNKK